MEMSTIEAAHELGLSQRQVQRLASAGRVAHRSIAGRVVVGGSSLVALSRTVGRGRRWTDGTASAAVELLESGSTDRIGGRELSRLRSRLAVIDVAELAYQALGSRVSVWRQTGAGTPRRLNDGLSATGSRLDVKITKRAAADYARSTRLLEDPEGDTLVVELDTEAAETSSDLALYAYGDVRTSSAARDRVENRLAQFR